MCIQTRGLLLRALNGEGTEFRVRVADLPDFLEFRRIAPCLDLIRAVPDLHDYAPLRRLTFDRRSVSGCKNTPAVRLDHSLSLRGIVLHIGIRVCRLDLADVIDRRLGLCVEAMDRDSANSDARNHCQCHCIVRFHAFLPVRTRQRAYRRGRTKLRDAKVNGTGKRSIGPLRVRCPPTAPSLPVTPAGQFGTSRWQLSD